MVLEEKALAYTTVEENLSSLSETVLKHHPEGRVPLLIHGTHILHESSVITEYLDEAFVDRPLRPASAIGRADVRLWTHWCNTAFKPDLDLTKYEWPSLPPNDQAALTHRLRDHFAKLDAALGPRRYLVEDTFSLADIHVFPFVRQFTRITGVAHGAELPPAVAQWLERIQARPSFERVMKK